jgi:hypothetical protein
MSTCRIHQRLIDHSSELIPQGYHSRPNRSWTTDGDRRQSGGDRKETPARRTLELFAHLLGDDLIAQRVVEADGRAVVAEDIEVEVLVTAAAAALGVLAPRGRPLPRRAPACCPWPRPVVGRAKATSK